MRRKIRVFSLGRKNNILIQKECMPTRPLIKVFDLPVSKAKFLPISPGKLFRLPERYLDQKGDKKRTLNLYH